MPSHRKALDRRSLVCLLALLPLGCASTQTPAPDAAAAEGERQTRAVQPGAPGTEGRSLSSAELHDTHPLPHTDADVRFMQDMIHHHAQALEMSALVPDRTENEEILLLARRIDRSQDDEIALMERWLRDRGEEPRHHHHGGHPADHPHVGMPGVLSPEQMGELAAARGDDFDRLFLEFMIFHHEGAIDMVEALLSTPGSAQGSELFQFASHVYSDQSIEIGRMYRMLNRFRTEASGGPSRDRLH